MHKVIKVVTTGSVGDLGRIARALANEGWDIAAVGGGEADVTSSDGAHEVGIMSFLIRDDEGQQGDIVELIKNVPLADGRTFESVSADSGSIVELTDEPGSLARAAEVLGAEGINILGVLLVDLHPNDGTAHVGFGFANDAIRDGANAILTANGFTVVDH